MFCIVAEVSAFAISFACKPAGWRTDIITGSVIQHVILIAAIAVKQKNVFAVVYILIYLSPRVPYRLRFYRIDLLLYAYRYRILPACALFLHNSGHSENEPKIFHENQLHYGKVYLQIIAKIEHWKKAIL